tara:strand:- start:251 stop:688 length:438 start_codon:yes stop_codon:yes gene_type:complete
MVRYSSGRFALRISDRDGMSYPYNEMVQEWTGAWVHQSEFEPKSPLLNPTNHPTDAQSLQHPLPQVISTTVPLGSSGGGSRSSIALGANGFLNSVQTIQRFNPIPAPGAYESVQVQTMQPLGNTDQANQDTRLNMNLGTTTVVIT